MGYDAFISYSHTADGRLAPAVQSGLQRLARPWYRTRALRVFRDETGLAVNPHLWASIEAALDESEHFVLLASPESAASPWVEREIEHWIAHKPVDRILPVLTDGDLVWDSAAGAYDVARSTALPPVLATAFVAEPRHLDLRWARTEEQLDLRHAGFRAAIAGLAAPMHGVSRDELEGEDVHQHRQAMRLAWGAAALLLFVTIAAVVAATFAVSYASEARANERRAVAEEAQARRNATEAKDQRTLAIQNASAAKSAQSQAEANAAEADRNAAEADQNATDATQQRQRAEENAAASARNAREAKANGERAAQQSVAAQQNAAAASANALQASANAQRAERNAAAAAKSAQEARSAADVAAAQRERALSNAERARAEQQAAEQAATLARSRQLAASALNVLATSPDRALVTAVQGRRFQVNAQTDDALMRTLERQPTALVGFVPTPPAVGTATRVVLSPDGRVLATVGRRGALGLRDVAAGRSLPTPDVTADPQARFAGLSFSADGHRLAVVTPSGSVVVWDVNGGRRVLEQLAASSFPPIAALSGDGRVLATYDDRGVVVVDVATGAPITTVPAAQLPADFSAYAIALDAGGTKVALGGLKLDFTVVDMVGRVVVLDARSGSPLADLTAETGPSPTLNDRHTVALRFEGTGANARLTSVAANAIDATVISWSTTTWTRVQVLPTPALEPGEIAAAVDPGLTQILTTDDAGLARVRDLTSGALVAVLPDARLPVCGPGCSGSLGVPDVLGFGPERTVVALGTDGLVRRFSVAADAAAPRLLRRLAIPFATGATAALAPGGARVATVTPAGAVDVLEADGRLVRTFVTLPSALHGLALSRDGATVAVVSTPAASGPSFSAPVLDVWDVTTGALRFHRELDLPLVSVVEFDPSGTLLAVPESDGFASSQVLLLDVATGRTLATVPASFGVARPSFTADGRTLVVGTFAGNPTVYDVADGRTRTLADPRLDDAVGVAFSEDGRVGVTTPAGAGEVVVVDGETLAVRRTISVADAVQGASVSPDGRRVAVSLSSGEIQLFDTGTGEAIGDRIGPSHLGSAQVVFADGGRRLVGYDSSGFLAVDLDPASWTAQACAIAGRNLTRAEWAELLGSSVPYEATCPEQEPAPGS
jgi:WD40 repeat protein